MSYIFDALQMTEAACVRGKEELISVTDLLERAEFRQFGKHLDATGEALAHISPNEGSRSERTSRRSHPDELVSKRKGDACADFWRRLRTVEIAPSACLYLAASDDKQFPATEAFRLLEVRLNRLRKERNLQILLVTSTLPQEGKTFITANMACAFSMGTEERILLIDGDLRRGSLSRMFDLGSSPGLCECLQQGGDLESAVVKLQGINVWILATGKATGNPLELIQSTKLPRLIDELRNRFNWVIVDSPPVLPLADTSAWAHLADGILLVTRPGTTEKRKLQAGVDAIGPQKLIGAVVNSSRNPSAADYGYYALSTR